VEEVVAMTALWKWGGEYFGYRDGDNLWTHDGRHVGRFRGDLIFGPNGRYLGELRNSNRLITNRSRSSRRGSSFTPYASRVGRVPYVNYVGYVMLAGYDDFPSL
jgi:hypothetical protein